VAFVLDTTGSMSGLIEAAKTKVWAIATMLAQAKPAPRIKMGLVGYRDRGDAYITKVTALTENLDAVYTELSAFSAGGGGDGPESVNQALHEAVTTLAWSKAPEVYRVVYLVGDWPPHMDYQDDVKYPATCQAAAQAGIIINTIQCGGEVSTTPVWQEIARLAEGRYFRVEQSGGAVLAETPFDKQLADLSRELDATRLYYGRQEVRARQQAKLAAEDRMYAAAPAAPVAARAEFNASAAGKANFLGEQELVADVAADKVELGKVKDDELPEALKKLSPAEREAKVKELAARRAALETRIAEVSKQRQTFLAEQAAAQAKEGKGALDQALFDSLRDQAAKKAIHYDTSAKRF
jgi:hypothetical protein